METTELDGVHTTELIGLQTITTQEKGMGFWCWAACTEMILRYDGIPESQERIAGRIHGFKEASLRGDSEAKISTANYHEIMHALCPEAPKTDIDAAWQKMVDVAPGLAGGGDVEIDSEQAVAGAMNRFVESVVPPITDLIQGHPAVVGLSLTGYEGAENDGHVYLFVGATYEPPSIFDKSLIWFNNQLVYLNLTGAEVAKAAADRFTNFYKIHEVVLIDPDLTDDPSTPVNEMRTVLTAKEFKERLQFALSRTDAIQAIFQIWNSVSVQ